MWCWFGVGKMQSIWRSLFPNTSSRDKLWGSLNSSSSISFFFRLGLLFFFACELARSLKAFLLICYCLISGASPSTLTKLLGLLSVPFFAFCINRNCLFLAINCRISESSSAGPLSTTVLFVNQFEIFESNKARKEYMSNMAIQLLNFSIGCVNSPWGFCGVLKLTEIFFLSCIYRSIIYCASSRISSPRFFASAIVSCKLAGKVIDPILSAIEWLLLF